MKAAQFKKPFRIKLIEQEKAKLEEYDLLVKVSYCGICGTDLHIYEGKVPYVKFPIIPGHEFAGKVTAIGSKVTDFSIGDRVTINPNLSCNDLNYEYPDYCYYCKKNRPHFCTNWEAIGVTRNGAFAEYVVCPNTSAIKVPDNVSLVEAVFMEPIACCLHGLHQITINPNDTVLVIGAGSIGLLMIALIKLLFKSKIIACEPISSRRNLAAQLGADITVNPSTKSLNELVMSDTNGYGVDISIEAVGSGATAYDAVNLLNRGGKALIFGVADPSTTINLNLFNLYNKELSIFGSFTNPHENNEALNILKKKSFEVTKLVSHNFPLDSLEKGLLLMKKRSNSVNKILIHCNE